jgi:integrase
VSFFVSVALRRGTKATYATHHRTFLSICAQLAIQPLAPLSEQDLCRIVTEYMRSGDHKVTTMPNFISAIADWARTHSFGELPRGITFQQLKQGILNWHGDENFSNKKEALTLADLRAIHGYLDCHHFEDARDWCAFIFAFFALLRIHEYADGGLLFRHVRRTDAGISLTISHSKTQLVAVQVEMVRRNDDLCPVLARQHYLNHIPAYLKQPENPFFLASQSSRRPMKDSQIIRRLKELASGALGRDPAEFSGHSFRRGGASALVQAGASEATIQSHGRWASQAVRGYYDTQHSSQLRQAPTALLLAHSSSSSSPSSSSSSSSSTAHRHAQLHPTQQQQRSLAELPSVVSSSIHSSSTAE